MKILLIQTHNQLMKMLITVVMIIILFQTKLQHKITITIALKITKSQKKNAHLVMEQANAQLVVKFNKMAIITEVVVILELAKLEQE